MKLILLCLAALAFTAQGQEVEECVTTFKDVMNRAHGFIRKYTQFKVECMIPEDEGGAECVPQIEQFEKCLPEHKVKTLLAAGEAAMSMFESAVIEIGDELQRPGVCKPMKRKITSLSKLYGGKFNKHLFEGEKCKEPVWHALLPKDACDCVNKCVIRKFLADSEIPEEFKALFTPENFDLKLEWLEDPLENEPPAFIRNMDIKAAGLCVVNACGLKAVEKVMDRNLAFGMFLDIMKVMKKRLESPPAAVKFFRMCQCFVNEGGNEDFPCQNAQNLFLGKDLDFCIEKKRAMMEDVKQNLIEVLSEAKK